MRLVVDANILVAELIRKRGRELIIRPELELYVAEKAWSEARYELNKRVAKMVQKGVFDRELGENLLADALALAEAKVSLIPDEIYAPLESYSQNSHPPRSRRLGNCSSSLSTGSRYLDFRFRFPRLWVVYMDY